MKKKCEYCDTVIEAILPGQVVWCPCRREVVVFKPNEATEATTARGKTQKR